MTGLVRMNAAIAGNSKRNGPRERELLPDTGAGTVNDNAKDDQDYEGDRPRRER